MSKFSFMDEFACSNPHYFSFGIRLGSYYLWFQISSPIRWLKWIRSCPSNAVRLGFMNGFDFNRLYPYGRLKVEFLFLTFGVEIESYPNYFIGYDSRDWIRFSDDFSDGDDDDDVDF